MNETSGARIEHKVERCDAGLVHRIRVANARKLNVLNASLMRALVDALERIDAHSRVVVLEGEGARAWIGGADIREMATLDRDGATAFITLLHHVCRAIRTCPVPVVAAIRGHCLGAGLEVAACCDLRIAETGASFAMPEVQVGLPSVIEAALLPRLVGAGRARDLVLTGRAIDAETALAWGLVSTVAPTGALDDAVEARLAEILRAAPLAVRSQKRLCARWDEQSLESAVDAGIEAFTRTFDVDQCEARDRLEAFLSRPRSEAGRRDRGQ